MSHKKINKKRIRKISPKGISSWLVIGGIALVLVAIYFINQASASAPGTASLEAKLEQTLGEGRPAFVFLHSTDCIPCKAMMDVVDQVYPEFQAKVELIDVDIYDQRNTNLMRKEGLQSIPTLVFYDRNGKRQMHIGVMEPEQFRQTLGALAAGQ